MAAFNERMHVDLMKTTNKSPGTFALKGIASAPHRNIKSSYDLIKKQMEPGLENKLDYEHLGPELSRKYEKNFQKIEIQKQKQLRVLQARLDRSEREIIHKKLHDYKDAKA